MVEQNLLNEKTLPLLGSIHLSDLKPLSKPIFLNGLLTGRYFEEIIKLNNVVEQENYGANLVLKYYDSHLPIGASPVNSPKVIDLAVKETHRNISILHELKNSNLNLEKYNNQIEALGFTKS